MTVMRVFDVGYEGTVCFQRSKVILPGCHIPNGHIDVVQAIISQRRTSLEPKPFTSPAPSIILLHSHQLFFSALNSFYPLQSPRDPSIVSFLVSVRVCVCVCLSVCISVCEGVCLRVCSVFVTVSLHQISVMVVRSKSLCRVIQLHFIIYVSFLGQSVRR